MMGFVKAFGLQGRRGELSILVEVKQSTLQIFLRLTMPSGLLKVEFERYQLAFAWRFVHIFLD